jgi:diguanylate cyclase (GGDEF)-like protein/PAS domain S-box-containing protein
MSPEQVRTVARPSPTQRARTLACLFLAGGVLGLCALLFLPLPADTSLPGTIAVVAFSFTVGVALLGFSRRIPEWAIPLALAMGTVVVSCDIYFAGRTPTNDEMFYTWIAFYAAYFLRPRLAALQIAVLGAGYGVALALRSEPDAATRWVIAVGTLSLAGILIARLVAQLERAARSADERGQALGEAEARFRSAFEDAAIGMAMVDMTGRWIRVNAALASLLGYPARRLIGMRFQDITLEEDLPDDVEALHALVDGRLDVYQTEKRYHRADGTIVWVDLSVSIVRDAEGRALHLISQMQDVTERKAAEDELTDRALHDALTGLPNRLLFVDRVEVALVRMERDPGPVAILFLDLDRFKLVNDSLGHAAGDRLLIEVGERLRHLLRPSDTVSRFGGDEFTILCEGLDERAASLVAERIAESLGEPFLLDGQELVVSASIGISIGRDPSRAAEEFLGEADAAMYRAKDTGRSRHAIFDGGMRLRGAERLALENDLRKAIARDELRVYYQPEVWLESARVYGVEALVRWQHPSRGLLAPGEFIPVAEDSGMIVALGEWVLREACRQVRTWQHDAQGTAALSLAVNVSPRQLADPHFCEVVGHALQSSGLDPGLLCLEITESTAVDVGLPTLTDLKALGVRLALDDFGVGFSSLNQIRRMPPVDVLKIDRSFVEEIGRVPTDQAIVAAIIGMARSLGIATIAEGIETADQAAILRRLGCDRGQGFHFARPAPPSAVAGLLASASVGELVSG